jgi:tetratricopeptide (TPR) repeat protein
MSAIARRAVRLSAIPAAVLALALALSSAPAHGADDKDAKAAAKEHYQRGTSFYDLGRYPEAIKEFEAAYQLKNDPAFLYNLAQSYRQAGDPEQALHFYRTYLRYVPKPPNRAEIDERIAALEKQIAEKGTATVQPPPVGSGATTTPPPPPPTTTSPTGTTTPPPPFGNPPGTPGGEPPTVQVSPPLPPPLPPTTTMAPPPPVAPAPPPPVSDRARNFQRAGIYTAAGGGLLLVIGIIEGVRARSASNEIESEATNGIPYDPAVQSRGKSAEKTEGVLITLGILAGAAGGGLWYYGKRLAAAEATTSYRISFAPVVSANGAGAWLRVGF